MKLVECVPNFSEGRRPEVTQAIRDAAAAVPHVAVLDVHADAAHNRMVLTMVGPPDEIAEAAVCSVARAVELIDLNAHTGEHPRMGAADVVPFIPVADATLSDCTHLARRVGRRLAEELDLPVYLYGAAATRPERRSLGFVRNRQYETIRANVATDPQLEPDYGPRLLGRAGATAVGARSFLVAFNVNLATPDLAIAREIARRVRESSGGLPAVQARGMATSDPGVTQVSMNLLDLERTPMHLVFERVAAEAAALGVGLGDSELVGLAPTSALAEAARHHLRLRSLQVDQTIEARLLAALLERL